MGKLRRSAFALHGAWWGLLLTAPAAGLLAGCESAQAEPHAQRKHGHQSLHGGSIVPIGDCHVEALLERGGTLRIYSLGQDEAELYPIEAGELPVHIQPGEAAEAVPVVLKAQRQPGDPPGAASEFSGRIPPEMVGKPLAVTLTVPVGEKRYRARVELQPHRRDAIDPEMEHMLNGSGGDHNQGMPAAVGSEAERELYGTPGGKYTQADIAANGELPSVKFKGIPSAHDMNPKPGDRICPITSTKANPRFKWTIGGQEYLFCCPPCVDEFVRRAKKEPQTIQPPTAYVKK